MMMVGLNMGYDEYIWAHFGFPVFWISLHTLSAGVSHSRHDGPSIATRYQSISRQHCTFLEFQSECFDAVSVLSFALSSSSSSSCLLLRLFFA